MNKYYLLCFLLGSVGGDPSLRAQTGTPAQRKPPASSQREPGLYMRFETSMGAINCKLFEKEAPVTVRTIVGLAVGKKAYVDPKTKQTVLGKRFFDGLTFHRVIPSFMIQGGDPLGTGQGGPEGLAMANAGPRTNGSQFFMTEVPTEYLNNKHTIFGQCENLDVVKAIARVPAKENKPVTPVVIKRLVVERVGPAPANPPEGAPARKPGPRPARPTKKS